MSTQGRWASQLFSNEDSTRQAARLSAGEWVEVLSKEEILRTLDDRGSVGGMPFMPEMLAFVGQRFQVFRRAHKTCDTVNRTGGRRIDDTVHLEGVRCSGANHGGCEANCLIFWKTHWLRRVDGPSGVNPRSITAPMQAAGLSEAQLIAATVVENSSEGPVFRCQATDLPLATSPLKWWDVRQYVEDFTSGNESLGALLRGALYVTVYNAIRASRRLGIKEHAIACYDWIQRLRGGVPYPRKRGRVAEGRKTPDIKLDLLPGDLVKVRSYDEILATLDGNNKNRGLFFDAEEVPYCGKLLRVRCRVSRIVDERTGKLIPIKGNSVILDGAWCKGHYSDRRMYCPRAIFPFWRETWLERVAEPGEQRYSADGMGGPVPSIDQQRTFWDQWNTEWRFRDPDYFMQRQLEVAQQLASDLSLKNARILEAGCGTGWLSNGLIAYGAVVATDLSPASIEEGRRRYPRVDLRCGDFLAMDLPDEFDLIISADALAHMHDQKAFFKRISGKLKDGGTFLLMTQNSFVWDRRSALKRLGHGQLQRWPSLDEIRTLLASDFEIQKIGSLLPGGDRGVLFWVENRYIRGAFGRILGRKRWESWLEALGLGREWVIVARKRAAGARAAG